MSHVWIAQAGGDRGGQILLVSTDETLALNAAKSHMLGLPENRDFTPLHRDAEALDLRDFVAKYGGASVSCQKVVDPPVPNTCHYCRSEIVWRSDLNGWLRPDETPGAHDDCSSTTDGYHSPQSAWIPDA